MNGLGEQEQGSGAVSCYSVAGGYLLAASPSCAIWLLSHCFSCVDAWPPAWTSSRRCWRTLKRRPCLLKPRRPLTPFPPLAAMAQQSKLHRRCSLLFPPPPSPITSLSRARLACRPSGRYRRQSPASSSRCMLSVPVARGPHTVSTVAVLLDGCTQLWGCRCRCPRSRWAPYRPNQPNPEPILCSALVDPRKEENGL